MAQIIVLVNLFFQTPQRIAKTGYSNLRYDDNDYNSLCRNFSLGLKINSTYEKSFPAAVVDVASPKDIEALKKRDNDFETINFHNQRFMVINASLVTKNKDLLRNKIVLIGSMDMEEDSHPTAIGRKLSGVEIHAYIISTILHQRYIKETSETEAWVFTFICIYLMLLINHGEIYRLLRFLGFRGKVLRFFVGDNFSLRYKIFQALVAVLNCFYCPIAMLLLVLAGYYAFIQWDFNLIYIYAFVSIGLVLKVEKLYTRLIAIFVNRKTL